MCGIFFSLHPERYILPSLETQQLLRNRGPDACQTRQLLTPISADRTGTAGLYATFLSTVLSLRGTNIVGQPLQDDASGSILCWNGEAWKIDGKPVEGNDSQAVFGILLRACSASSGPSESSSHGRVMSALSSITGPFAFVFYDAVNGAIYYGRDCLGRRSLLRKITGDDQLIISSVCDNEMGDQWVEVEADGIYTIDLRQTSEHNILQVLSFPHARKGASPSSPALLVPFPSMNATVPEGRTPVLDLDSPSVHQLDEVLRKSLELRIRHVRESIPSETEKNEAKVSILFSGGLDCTVLARLCHDILPAGESVDLLNVAFQNPRIHGAIDAIPSPFELCPDRITGRSSFTELQKTCPDRLWRFVEVNVPYTETVAHRANVMTLMHPHNTEMDLSISYALYFASRGVGRIQRGPKHHDPEPYTSPAHVLLSGLGADELFGGYQRHALAHLRKGYAGLIEELELDFNRLGKRNLGRDDRVLSDSGKEVRFPYLDEELIGWALDCPIWGKCGFGEKIQNPFGLEPEKRVLRLLAWRLGMEGVAREKKRAIQFGARTAKMETGRVKGTQVLS